MVNFIFNYIGKLKINLKSLCTIILFTLINLPVFADTTIIPTMEENEELAEKFMFGTLELFDIPKYIKYLTEKAVWIAGLIAVIFVMIGGYKYIIGAYKENQEDGKNAIINVITGLAYVLLAWMLIDLVIRLITE